MVVIQWVTRTSAECRALVVAVDTDTAEAELGIQA